MDRDASQRIQQQKLGEDRGRIAISGKDEFRLACECLAQQARRQLDIFTHDLDAPLYDQKPFLDALKDLVTTSRHAQVRILLQDNNRAQKEGHRLIELARRLTSAVEIRRPYDDYLEYPDNFMIVDRTGFVHRELYTQYEGEVEFHDPVAANEWSKLFSDIWERSEQDTDLRRLYL